MINFPYTPGYKRIEKGGCTLYKDTELRWEIISVIRQIECLVDQPEKIAHNDAQMVPGFGRKLQELADRAQRDHHYHFPTQSEYARLLGDLNQQLMELMMLQLTKHRIWCEEQSEEYCWSEQLKTLYKSQSLYLSDVVAMLAQGRFTEVMEEVLPKRPPIIDIRAT
jgi:hypothetical protein